MNRKFANVTLGKALFLFSVLLAMGFVFTGCEYNDFYAPDYVIGHVHEYARGDHDGNLVSRYGVPYYYLYEDLGKVDPYNYNELLGLLPDIYLNCESSYPEYEKYHCVDCGLEIWRKTGKVCERLGHACTDWKIDDKPTCTQPGLEVITCIRDGCSYRLTRELPAKGHDIVQVERKEPTCTEEAHARSGA